MDTATLCPVTEAEILAAVAAQRDETVQFLQALVAEPSLLGHEASAQALMARGHQCQPAWALPRPGRA